LYVNISHVLFSEFLSAQQGRYSGCGCRKRPIDIQNIGEYIEYKMAGNQKWVVLQIRIWARE
jgi:hypothetical protein